MYDEGEDLTVLIMLCCTVRDVWCAFVGGMEWKEGWVGLVGVEGRWEPSLHLQRPALFRCMELFSCVYFFPVILTFSDCLWPIVFCCRGSWSGCGGDASVEGGTDGEV